MANPFPFVAGQVLTAAQLNGIGEAATAFTPTFTGYTRGNGTSQSYYTRVNKLVFVSCFETLGTTSAVTGTIAMTLPVTASRQSSIPVSRGYIEDTGVQLYWATIFPQSTTKVQVFTDATGGTYASNGGVSSTVPMTWGNLDNFGFAFVYEAA